MSQPPERQPGISAGSGVSVKPVVRAHPAPDDRWLDDVVSEAEEAARRIDLLAADFDLVTTLALQNFEGPDWLIFEDELAKYGLAVFQGWIRSGKVFDKYTERGYGGLPTLRWTLDDDDVDDLAVETLAYALVHFKSDVLMRGKWDYRRGASLRTYFIGQCLMRFANVYRRWWQDRNRNYHLHTDADVLAQVAAPINGPDARAVNSLYAEQSLALVKDPRVRDAMRFTAQGWSQAEIAEAMGLTVKTVERMLANQRDRQGRREAG